MNKRAMKKLNFYFPITRVDEDSRTVEGYAFRNEVVPGEGGIRLKRSAMEAATPDYEQWGTIRAMHQPIAAGVLEAVTWDDNGAFIRVNVVDNQEWEKVKAKVYKGFSVGVRALAMRGLDVERAEWIETSLVDRPKDPDALITAFRVSDTEAPYEAEVLARASFAEYLEGCAATDLRNMALDYLWHSLWDIQYMEGADEEKDAAVRETCGQFTEFVVGMIVSGTLPNIKQIDGDDDEERAISVQDAVARLASEPLAAILAPLQSIGGLVAIDRTRLTESYVAVADHQAEISRLDQTVSALTVERDAQIAEVARVRGLVTAAEARVKELEKQPARVPPVRNPVALPRAFGTPDPESASVKAAQSELDELSRLAPSADPSEQQRRIIRIGQLKRALTSARS